MDAPTANSDNTNSFGNLVSTLGSRTAHSNSFLGSLDEVAVWKRALTAAEVATVYKRGAGRLKLQVRAWSPSTYPSCVNGTESAPSCPDFAGPSGSTAAYYSELSNSSTAFPSQSITASGGGTLSGRFFQYKVFFDANETVSTPNLSSVTVTNGQYDTTNPSIVLKVKMLKKSTLLIQLLPNRLAQIIRVKFDISRVWLKLVLPYRHEMGRCF